LKIRLAELRRATDILFDYLEATGHQEVEISEDYYWVLPKESLYDPYKEPTNFMMGQLSHDVERLQELVSGASPPIAYGLVWLGAVLHVVGAKVIG
jgi:hypothetical protein